MTRLEPRIRAYAEQAAAELPLGRSVDFVESFALRVPAAVIGELLGLERLAAPATSSAGRTTSSAPHRHPGP